MTDVTDATNTTSLRWRKSARSGSNGGACVELAALPGRIAARDSKNPGGGMLTFGVAEMTAFLQRVRTGDLDLR